ncbi:MAG: hypothetical protein HOJ48_07955 [Desulfobacula sp.]|mgnify:FL=1|jgi:hypothetical protein|uniref:hypothetical protein n=1 Tax=Desulfobacula sp. TaxID=2593537 RepID=UPI001DB725E2|nr:hypothetical protein [Deltaproteobacteria bacterium]MBT4527828.1 hypothetical protein [Deltaproteobacteria bacterium]MBT4874871.1 hypothetical protein [Desulfobacula sp.]MBT6339209.1 hypothetical protein [Desulfobacula sp.]MBT7793319.1 hypothetical protein [Desulfobacula sp.]
MDESLFHDLEEIFTGERSHETFLEFYNFTTKSFKLTPEYVAIIKDIKSLTSMDKSELEKRIKNANFDIKNFNNAEEDSKHEEYFDKAWSGIDLKSEIDFLKKMPLDNLSPDETNLGSIFLLGKILAVEYEAKLSGEELLLKNKALAQFLTNTSMEFNLKKLISSSEFLDISIDLIYKIRDIGADHSLFESSETLQNNQLQDLMHKIISSRAVNKRHAKRQNKYDYAIDDAQYLWGEQGDTRNINEMVTYLLSQKKYSSLSERSLRKKIHDTAQKYDKIPRRGRPRKK